MYFLSCIVLYFNLQSLKEKYRDITLYLNLHSHKENTRDATLYLFESPVLSHSVKTRDIILSHGIAD